MRAEGSPRAGTLTCGVCIILGRTHDPGPRLFHVASKISTIPPLPDRSGSEPVVWLSGPLVEGQTGREKSDGPDVRDRLGGAEEEYAAGSEGVAEALVEIGLGRLGEVDDHVAAADEVVRPLAGIPQEVVALPGDQGLEFGLRSEERRVGKECRSRW